MSIGLYPIGLVPVGLTGEIEAGGGGGDVTAPVLTSPTGENTGKYSAIGSVSTNEANGDLYYLTNTSPTATAAAVKAGGIQAVTATGVQEITVTGLAANTGYYNHYLHRDAAGNDSAVASSAQWFTQAEVAPQGVVTIGTVTPGATTASVPFNYSAEDALGFEYRINGGAAQSVVANPISLSGLTASTAYTIEVRAVNAGGNGAWSAAQNFTTTAVTLPGFTLVDLVSNAGAPIAGQSGITVDVYNASTGALVVRKTGLTSTAGADVAVSDAALAIGTTYNVFITIGAAFGAAKATAA